MPEVIIYVGSPGAGKSTHYKKHYSDTHFRVSQDVEGLNWKLVLENALLCSENIVVDRQNHIRAQRTEMIKNIRGHNKVRDQIYTIKIIEFKVSKQLCENRILARKEHETITDRSPVWNILNRYRMQYQAILPEEYDEYELIKTSYYSPIQDLTHLKGNILVVGDPHGCFSDVMQLVNKTNPDHVIIAGDMCDRGPEVREMLEYVKNTPNVYSVIGNHDCKLKRWAKGNKVSVKDGLQSSIDALADYTPEQLNELYEWLGSLPAIIKLPKKYVVVHAGMNPDKPLERQLYDTSIFIRNHGGPHFSDKDYPKWYECEPCSNLKQYHILFGHAIHEEARVADWATSLDMGAVYGMGIRGALIDTTVGDNTTHSIHELSTKRHYISSREDRSPFSKRDKLVEQGYLDRKEQDGLVLYNYRDKTTFERYWLAETLESRGTVYDLKTGEIVARAFNKFFNLNEDPTTMENILPWSEGYQVFEKMDGSMGLHKNYKEKHSISTRGSFTSEQAIKATEMLNDGRYDLRWLDMNPEWNLIFEIIYPDNKIVVDYGNEEKLTLIGGYVTTTGVELTISQQKDIATKCGFELPKAYGYDLAQMLEHKKTMVWNEDEGFVVRFHNGLRVKIKGDDYMRMAKIISHMSPLSFWESMVSGKIQEYRESIPEELREQADEIYDTLESQLRELREKCAIAVDKLGLLEVNSKDKEARKVVAMAIQQQTPNWMHGYLYSTLSGRQSDETLLKMIRPVSNIYVDLKELHDY